MAACPECKANLKVAPGKLVICPKCKTKFRAPAEDARKPAKTPAKPADNAPEPVTDDMYGFTSDEVDLAEVRRKREEEEKARAEERAKKEKPVIEIKRKNIGDLDVWEVIDKSLNWFQYGIFAWAAAHILYGLILFLGMVQGPEYAVPVVTKLIRADQPVMEVGVGDSLDRPAFVTAMLGGIGMFMVTLVLLAIIQVLGWVRTGLWVTGAYIAWPSAPVESGGKGQLIAVYSLAGFNFVVAFFLVFLPFVGAYGYCVMPWSGAELALAEYNMERTLPLHVFWAAAPFWETLLSFILTGAVYFEPIMIAYFLWTCASSIKDEETEQATLSAVKMGFAVLFVLLTFRLFALAGTSPVLVKVLRILYFGWYVAVIGWMVKLSAAISRCRDMFKFYLYPDED